MCEYNSCSKRATYGINRDNPIRCKKHKEYNMKLISASCKCGRYEPCFNEEGEKNPICCSLCKTNTMINVKHKKCKCGKRKPSFNEIGKDIGICCSLCKTSSMVNINSKTCKCGKKKSPSFNEPGEKNPICCSSCKTNTMINVRLKKCKCGKASASFNEPGKKIRICCSLCKTNTMICTKNRKCKCGKIAIFNYEGQKIGICCGSCKLENMVNVANKKCKCGKSQPSYNEKDKKNPICCASCKTETMINVINKKCKCGKIPYYNEKGKNIGICCASCKTDTMINVRSKKCKCGKAQPYFNKSGEIKPICCASCKTPDMINIIDNICLGLINNNEPCPYNYIGNPKYKNYCTECYRRNFPLDPLTFQIRSKTKEIAVRDYINANLEGFQHDTLLSTSHCDCTIRRRIDHRKLINNTLLVIETDENQHKSYDQMDEETRYDDLYMAFSGKWIYIRFNPDKYVAKNGKNKNPMISTRLPVLLDEIKKQIIRIEKEENTELVERIYMYYDNYD